MKCSGHSILGVLIGTFCIFTCCLIIADIFMSVYLEENEQPTSRMLTLALVLINYISLIFCFMMAIVSGFLVAGIIKRRSELMKPWIHCAVAGIVYQCLRIIILHHYGLFQSLFFGLLYLIAQILIFYTIYTLYEDIHKANKEAVQTNLNGEVENVNQQAAIV